MTDRAREVIRQFPFVCGEHLCEEYGDCLACYSGDECAIARDHFYAGAVRIWGDDTVECEHDDVRLWHHRDFHKPFDWGWRVRAGSAWFAIKRAAVAVWRIPRG